MVAGLATNQRQCRVSQHRTIDTVRKAINTWCRIYGKDPINFKPARSSCSEVLAAVKELLANCPSSIEEERMAWQSIKKLLPASCKCMENGFLDRLVEGVLAPPRRLPDGYLKFVEKETSKLFGLCWDRTYREHCYTTGPPLSSTLESGRSAGGGLNTSMDQSEFLSMTLGMTADLPSLDIRAKPMLVQSAGKPRPLTKFSEQTLLLKPLHKSIYDHLSTKVWLARGTPDAEMLDRAGFRRGIGELVSGDYRSATDNLPLEVAETILDVILRKSSRVPSGIQDYARRILRPIFLYKGEEIKVSSGQQMGSLLSFPLLCIQNYLAFRWAVRSSVGLEALNIPVLINGDDILFQSPHPAFPRRWMDVVGEVGLEVEQTKTSVDETYGSLNSTLYRWKSGRLREVPTLRFGMLRTMPFANSLAASFSAFAKRGLPAQVRFNAGLEFLKWHSSLIVRTNLAPSELGFSGRFAWRCFLKSGLLRTQKARFLDDPFCRLTKSLPKEPCVHNIVLADEVDWVPSVTKEEEMMTRREIASWKWRKRGDFVRSLCSMELSYWLELSRPAVDWHRLERILGGGRWKRREFPGWYSVVKEKYFEPRPVVEKKVMLFKGIDRLPTYDEVVLQCGLAGEHLEYSPVTQQTPFLTDTIEKLDELRRARSKC
uniref:RNA-dependent RNA polymerase n=1 Tax=Zhangzhou Botou tick virus 6 TaxID=2972056 RepID=A0A9E8AAF8_9VIRU|nr:MAG: RNA-dependent RNA polymerase [Zhangzhou Botou tick virus 6]